MAAGGGPVDWLLFPTVGALIGWSTNLLAIRLLFRPHRPLRIAGLTLQGLLPRRRAALAETVGQVVADELLRRDELLARALEPGFRRQVAASIARAAGEATLARLPGFLPAGVRTALAAMVRDAAAEEAERFTRNELPALAAGLLDGLDVAGVVRRRLEALDLNELEALAYRLARRELRHIEVLGGVLGGLVGLAQAAAVTWLFPLLAG